ncbi:hypothetical protein ACQPZX_17325 [Actinoplanes sp. CA-142083]|uniref:hypothetical protein n=1 Tax=Actinoplanes sp. CA-142083 TaxID=3239903 RepID=UPI003D930FC1
MKRSWMVVLVSVALAATGVVVCIRLISHTHSIDSRYRAHRAALAELAQQYVDGHLDGMLTLPPGLRSLSPSGFAYASPTALFVQTWQNWRAESGTGLAFFAATPTAQTTIATASGDAGQPQREVGDGWWWVE